MLRAVVKHFSPTRVHKSQFWPFSTEQGRCFFHCGCMPGTGAIRWGDISFRTSPRRPIEPPILTRRTRDQQTGGTGVMGTAGPGRGAGGRRQGLAKQQANAPSNISDLAPLVWRAPEGPEGTAAVPEGGGRARAGLEIDHSEPQARVWRSRGRAAAHRHTQRPAPSRQATRRPEIRWRPEHQRHSTSSATGKGNPYSPRNALIAGISRTACTRPAR